MDRLSPELLHIVASFLSTRDAATLRLVCKNYSVIAGAHIIPEVSFYTHAKDLARLRAIAEHPVFSRHVKSLTYFGAVLESPPLSLEKFLRDHKQSVALREFANMSSPSLPDVKWKAELSRPQLEAQYDKYRQLVASQEEIRRNRLVPACLKEVMPKFPNLRLVTMSSGFEFYEGGEQRSKASPYDDCVHEAQSRFKPEGCLHLEVLLEALAQSDIRIEHLRAGSLSWRFFEKAPEDLSRFFKPLTNLTYIDLILVTEMDDNGNDINDDLSKCRRSLRSGLVRNLLRSMPRLETLSFAIHSGIEDLGQGARLGDVIQVGHHWPNLSDLSIQNVECNKSDLINFLELHKGSLKSLCLQDIQLTQGSWKNVLPYIRQNLHLDYVCICGTLSGHSEDEGGSNNTLYCDEQYFLWDPQSGPSDMRSSVNLYCQVGGEAYPDVLPLDKETVRKHYEQYVRRPGVKSEAEDREEMRGYEKEVRERILELGLFRPSDSEDSSGISEDGWGDFDFDSESNEDEEDNGEDDEEGEGNVYPVEFEYDDDETEDDESDDEPGDV